MVKSLRRRKQAPARVHRLQKAEPRGVVVTKVSRQMGMGRPPIGEKAMTSAERVARWRERHARKHAPLPPRATTMDDWMQLFPTQDDWDRWLGRKPWDDDNK